MQQLASDAPLAGVRLIEFAGIGPGPFAGMMLADMGAEIIRIDRPGAQDGTPELDFMGRGRKSLVLNLKSPDAVQVALRLIDSADGLIEGFRPGVMERLGLGPELCRARNPRLVYGRMTGWGQTGPLSHAAGHDLNYIALSGALWATGDADRPPSFALNLLGDFGGGGMFLAFGMVSGLFKAARTGRGDVVDAAICDGTASLMSMIYGMRAKDTWSDQRAANKLDGGAPWYGVYKCADGQWVSIGALEPQFWALLQGKLGLTAEELGDRSDRSTWPALRAYLTELFETQSRDHWVALLEGTDACFAPVLSPAEAPAHPHNVARGTFSSSGPAQPMPAPRFADADTPLPAAAPAKGRDSRSILTDLGLASNDIDNLFTSGAAK